jgi:Uma2 family endonuclease
MRKNETRGVERRVFFLRDPRAPLKLKGSLWRKSSKRRRSWGIIRLRQLGRKVEGEKAMQTQMPILIKPQVIYPESDGMPMADNTKQFRYIVTIKEGLEALFANEPRVFVAGDFLWYPVEGDPKIRAAPDAMVVFGRPKGDRGSYLQWLEEGIAPQVVFEILSPGNTLKEMTRKYNFYERYGVEEYYIYDPDRGELSGWLRRGEQLEEIEQMQNWTSPRLNIRFELRGDELDLFRPDGARFLTFVELMAQKAEAEERAEHAEERAEHAEERAEHAEERALRAEERSKRLAAQLRAMGIEPENGATAS